MSTQVYKQVLIRKPGYVLTIFPDIEKCERYWGQVPADNQYGWKKIHFPDGGPKILRCSITDAQAEIKRYKDVLLRVELTTTEQYEEEENLRVTLFEYSKEIKGLSSPMTLSDLINSHRHLRAMNLEYNQQWQKGLQEGYEAGKKLVS